MMFLVNNEKYRTLSIYQYSNQVFFNFLHTRQLSVNGKDSQASTLVKPTGCTTPRQPTIYNHRLGWIKSITKKYRVLKIFSPFLFVWFIRPIVGNVLIFLHISHV